MKNIFRYDHGIARLEVEGLPDLSLEHDQEKLGIILSWKINLIGFPQLEGKKEHLEVFVSTISQYARHYISGVQKTFGLSNSLVSITPINDRHQVFLRSTREGVKPLKIILDDADLVDLTKCFDQLRNDPRVLVDWKLPKDRPLKRGDLKLNSKIARGFFFPLLGCITSLGIAIIFLFVPIDTPDSLIMEEKTEIKK